MAQPAPSSRADSQPGHGLLGRWGRIVHRNRRIAALVPILITLCFLPLALSVGENLSTAGWLPQDAEALQVDGLLETEFGRDTTAHYILFSDPTGRLKATDTAFLREVERTLAPLRNDEAITAIYTLSTVRQGDMRSRMLSSDGMASIAVIFTDLDSSQTAEQAGELRSLLQSDLLEVTIGGWPITTHDLRSLAESDLTRAEMWSLPLTIVVLCFVFGGVLAAGLPILVTAMALVPTLAMMALLAREWDTSVFAVNLVVMIGLAIGIDYALMLASRFREESRRHDAEDALAISLDAAGKTIIGSGVAVAIGLLGLVVFGVEAAITTAAATACIVAFSVLLSLTLLPAWLAILGPPKPRKGTRDLPGLWKPGLRAGRWPFPTTPWLSYRRIRDLLDRWPLGALVVSVACMAVLAWPAHAINLGMPGLDILPPDEPARIMVETTQERFAGSDLSPIVIVVQVDPGRTMTSPTNDRALTELIATLASQPHVTQVVSAGSFLPEGIDSGFIAAAIRLDGNLQALARPYLTTQAAVIELHLDVPSDSPEAQQVVTDLRASGDALGQGRFTLLVGGETATIIDVTDHLESRGPWAVAAVLGAMVLALGIQFRSVVIPIKALVLNMLPIASAFGLLTWIFQEGHLAGLLGFEPLGYIAVFVPIIVFCLMFGLSMDYEVIMLSRIREEWQTTGDNRLAVRRGLASSAGIVTSAAAIMLIVFGAFGASRLQIIQQIGLCLGVAVLLDATLVRLVALPAAMTVFGKLNWWHPFQRRKLS